MSRTLAFLIAVACYAAASSFEHDFEDVPPEEIVDENPVQIPDKDAPPLPLPSNDHQPPPALEMETTGCSNSGRYDKYCDTWNRRHRICTPGTKHFNPYGSYHCKKFCGLCKTPKPPPPPPPPAAGSCKDARPSSCPRWKRSGYCKSHSYVKKNCKNTCNLCGGSRPSPPPPAPRPPPPPPPPPAAGSCKDARPSDCPRWKRGGYCSNNSYVKRNCKKTCNLCGGSRPPPPPPAPRPPPPPPAPRLSAHCDERWLKDHNTSQCRHWGKWCDNSNRGHRNYVQRTCPRTCCFGTKVMQKSKSYYSTAVKEMNDILAKEKKKYNKRRL